MEATATASTAPDDSWVAAVRLRVLNWAPTHFQQYPWRRPLPFWQGLVVEVLLQRTRASQVAPVFKQLRRRYPSALSFGSASADELSVLLAPLGLRWRIPLLVRLAYTVGQSRGRLPRSIAELQQLPGVGPYAAGAALSLHGTTRALVIDSNTVRLVCRLLGAERGPETRRAAWVRELFERLVPDAQHREFNYAMLDLGMTVCRPRIPDCANCPLASLCVYRREDI